MHTAILEKISLTRIQETALAYWKSKSGQNKIPLFDDFDLLDISECLPNLVLFEVKTNPFDFYYKMIGSNVDAHNSEAFTGKLMSELAGKGPGSMVWGFFSSVVETEMPDARELPYVGRNKEFERIEIVALPLCDGAGTVSHIIVVTDYFAKHPV